MNHEARLHFIWKNRLFTRNRLKTTCGLELEVIHPGEQNPHAGPDFFNARIRFGKILWAGNVEIHHRASQWNHHGHNLDPAYDNVILHVIGRHDKLTKNSKGRMIPSLVLDPSNTEMGLYEKLSTPPLECLPCQAFNAHLSENQLSRWLHTLSVERLNQKIEHASQLLCRFSHNRDKALFLAMASGFGLPINKLPFELMASRIPLPLLMEIKDSIPQLEALLFGHSGLLTESSRQDSYTSSLWKHYNLLKSSIPGRPLPRHLWKFLRIRPASFPTLRMSQFALFIHHHFPVNNDFMNIKSTREFEQKFNLHASEYWNTHYLFGRPSPPSVKRLGKQACQNLIINVIIPCLQAIERVDRGIIAIDSEMKLLHEMNAESNQIIKIWAKFGMKPRNAFESQALIELYKGFCMNKRCKHCQIEKISRGTHQ